MNFLYPFFVAFFLIFLSELGDKTQLLVLSFSSKIKSYCILIGVALGSFFSHGIAIIFGSTLGNLNNSFLHIFLKFITYISFILFGFITLYNKEDDDAHSNKLNLLNKIYNLKINYIFIIAFSIAIGELGDKTFLASLGLGIQYPNYKLFLIIGAILGMIVSDLLAILFGKFLSKKFSNKSMSILSSIIFFIFGFFGLIGFFADILAY